jgi:hypothetical protein
VTKELTALTSEMDCDQRMMGLLPVTSSVFVIFFLKCGCLGGMSGMSLLPLRGWSVSGMYVSMYPFTEGWKDKEGLCPSSGDINRLMMKDFSRTNITSNYG